MSLQHELVWIVHGTVHVVLNCVCRYIQLVLCISSSLYSVYFSYFLLSSSFLTLFFPFHIPSFVFFYFSRVFFFVNVKGKGEAILAQVCYRPWGFQEVEVLRFQDSRHMKVVRLLARCTSRLYPSGHTPGTQFCLRLSRPQGHSAAGRIVAMKNL